MVTLGHGYATVTPEEAKAAIELNLNFFGDAVPSCDNDVLLVCP